MHPEDRVLVAVMRQPRDLEIAREHGWYRVPEKHAPPGIFAEYLAFYFTAAFGEAKWGIHFYARNLGHELVSRLDLLPGEPSHPRAHDCYYKLQLGPLQQRQPPILSQRWRRIIFIHTTWDRFEAAHEINDLYIAEGEFVDRLYHALRDAGLAPERHYPLREEGVDYQVDLAVPCRRGVLAVGASGTDRFPPGGLCFTPEALAIDPGGCLDAIRTQVNLRGGLLPFPGQHRQAPGQKRESQPMMITVKMGAPLSQVVGESRVMLSLPERATVADLLAALRRRFPEFEAALGGKGLRRPTREVLYAMFVNARPVPFDQAGVTPLTDGDQVYFFLPIAGG